VYQNDKQEKEEIMDCVHNIPCGNCDKTYMGETERKSGTSLRLT